MPAGIAKGLKRRLAALWQRHVYLVLFGLLAVLAAPSTVLADNEPVWGVTPMLGIYRPSLKELNKGEFKAPLPGRGRIIFPDTGVNIDFDFMIDNPLSSLRFGAEAGLSFHYFVNPRHALLFGLGSWEATSTSTITTEIPFQGALTTTLYERSGNISYFQYFLGWRWTMLSEGPYRVHLITTLHELFDTDYKETLAFAFQSGEAAGFKRLITMQSQATGGEMIRLGVAADYQFTSQFSLGLQGGYFWALRHFRLGNASLQTDLQDQDNTNFRLPARQDASGQIQYLAGATGFNSLDYRDLRLDFGGWGLMLRANIDF